MWLEFRRVLFRSYDNEQKCPICNEKSVFENTVNLTNGSFDEDDNRIDGYIEPELIDKSELKCKCGKVHICECSIYKIPEYKNE